MKYLYSLIGACLCAAFLAACGGSNSISSSMPLSAVPQAARVTKNAQIYNPLYTFAGGSDGADPQAGLTNVGGTLYGTTLAGGGTSCYYGFGCGTVFKITSSGTYGRLYSFTGGSDGAAPQAGLTNVGGTLYGTTSAGGTSGNGTVFTIYNGESVLYSFANGSDGRYPMAGLTNVGGTLYGTTESGGTNGGGTVFKITTSGAESVLHGFGYGFDGQRPMASLTNVGGTLYGTTEYGGTNSGGTVFKITNSGAESVIYSFAGGSDGAEPVAALTNVAGTLYGTTLAGGGGSCYNGCGTLFKITTSGAESVLYSFAGGSDGAEPMAGLTNVGGTLYGTTSRGGASDYGVIFALVKKKGPEFVLYSFDPSYGGIPWAGLTNVGGTLYGTTKNGGASGSGSIFSFLP